MELLREYPPNIAEIRKVFDLSDKSIVFTYGDRLYAPSGKPIPDNLWEHEKTHMRQQGSDPEGWWRRYLTDPQFRLDQEAEAYRNQYAYVQEHGSREVRREFLAHIARDLSSKIYGGITNFKQAKQLITQ